MGIQTYLQDYSQRADRYLDIFFKQKLSEAQKIGQSSNGLLNVPKEMLRMYRDYMRGGKKLRGALVQLGFGCGGGDREKILPVSVAVEILHSFLLMHDDVIDEDDFRRGKKTVHKQWEQIGRNKLSESLNCKHFGESLAYTLGDVGGFLGMGLMMDSNFPANIKLKGLLHLNEFLLYTGYGQGLDVAYEASDHLVEDDVLRVHLYKSAYYTISGPLKLGGILVGLKPSQLKAMEEYGECIGIAFQLRDDELGLFGDEKIIGKPVGSDVRENKNTVLHIKAIELGSDKDRSRLKKLYGKADLNKQDLKLVQQITIDVGALDYSRQLINDLVKKGKKAIPQMASDSCEQEIFGQIADYIVERKK